MDALVDVVAPGTLALLGRSIARREDRLIAPVRRGDALPVGIEPHLDLEQIGVDDAQDAGRPEDDHHRRPLAARAVRHLAMAHAPIATIASEAPTRKVINPPMNRSVAPVARADLLRYVWSVEEVILRCSRMRASIAASRRRVPASSDSSSVAAETRSGGASLRRAGVVRH